MNTITVRPMTDRQITRLPKTEQDDLRDNYHLMHYPDYPGLYFCQLKSDMEQIYKTAMGG